MKTTQRKYSTLLTIAVCINLAFVNGMPSPVIAEHDMTEHGEAHSNHSLNSSDDHQQVKTDEVYKLDEIVVTAEKIEEYIKNHPQHVISIDSDEIRERNFLNVGEALNSMPGVDVNQRTSGLGTRISIRGSGGSGSVLVLMDGRSVNSGQYGGVDLETIPIDTIKKITIFKPPVPVWLGAGSTAGAVSIITKDSDSSKADGSEKTRGRLKIGAGSFETINMSCSYSLPHKNGSTMISAGGGHIEGKHTNSDKDNRFFSLSWDTKDSNNTHYKIGGRYYHAEHGCPGPRYNLTPDARQKYDKGSIDFGMEGLTGQIGEFSLKSYADLKDLEDLSQTGDKSMLEVYKIGIKGEHTWTEESGTWAFRLGGKFERDSVDHTSMGSIVNTGDHQRNTASLHLQYDTLIHDFTTSIGIRGDHTSDFGYSPAGNFGVSYGIKDTINIKTNAGYSINIPSFGQLYQPSHGSIDQARGNPDLLEERVFSYDLAFEYKHTKDLIFETALFRTETKDLIVYERGADLITRPQNIGKGVKQGVEFSCKYNQKKRFSVDFNYIWQETENQDTGKDFNYTPSNKGKISLKYVFPFQTKIETIIRSVSSQYTDIENSKDTELSPYTTVDLKIIQPVRIRSLQPELYIHFYNLFDTDYESHYGYPDDGFRFVCGMNLNF